MENLNLGLDLADLDGSAPECFECPLSECNPEHAKCAVKGKTGKGFTQRPKAKPQPRKGIFFGKGKRLPHSGGKNSLIDIPAMVADVGWLRAVARIGSGAKPVIIAADTADEILAHGIGIRPYHGSAGTKYRVQFGGYAAQAVIEALGCDTRDKVNPAAKATSGYVQVVAPEIKLPNTVNGPAQGCPEKRPIVADAPVEVDRSATISDDIADLVAHIDAVCSAGARDLTWAAWAIGRELDRRRA